MARAGFVALAIGLWLVLLAACASSSEGNSRPPRSPRRATRPTVEPEAGRTTAALRPTRTAPSRPRTSTRARRPAPRRPTCASPRRVTTLDVTRSDAAARGGDGRLQHLRRLPPHHRLERKGNHARSPKGSPSRRSTPTASPSSPRSAREIPATANVASVARFSSRATSRLRSPASSQDGGDAADDCDRARRQPARRPRPAPTLTGVTLAVTGHPEAVVSYAERDVAGGSDRHDDVERYGHTCSSTASARRAIARDDDGGEDRMHGAVCVSRSQTGSLRASGRLGDFRRRDGHELKRLRFKSRSARPLRARRP